jgi:hypothetical protein
VIKIKSYTTRQNTDGYLPPAILVDSPKVYPAFCKIVKPQNLNNLINDLLKQIDTDLKYINIVINNLRQSVSNINLNYVLTLKDQLIIETTLLKTLKSSLDPCSQSVSEVNTIKLNITNQKVVIARIEQLITDYENLDVLTSDAQVVLNNGLVEIERLKDEVNVKIRRVNELGNLTLEEV